MATTTCQRIKPGWWLGHPSEKYESQLGWLFPIYGKIKNGNQTTNQHSKMVKGWSCAGKVTLDGWSRPHREAERIMAPAHEEERVQAVFVHGIRGDVEPGFGRHGRSPVSNYIPDAPCMEYLPTFGWFLGQMLVNIPAPWSIWVWHMGLSIVMEVPPHGWFGKILY